MSIAPGTPLPSREIQKAADTDTLAAAWGNRVPEHAPTYRLDQFIAEGRREMGEELWAKRNAEWDV